MLRIPSSINFEEVTSLYNVKYNGPCRVFRSQVLALTVCALKSRSRLASEPFRVDIYDGSNCCSFQTDRNELVIIDPRRYDRDIASAKSDIFRYSTTLQENVVASKFLTQQTQVECAILTDKTRNVTFVIVSPASSRIIRTISGMFYALFPSFAENTCPDSDEYRLLHALLFEDQDEFSKSLLNLIDVNKIQQDKSRESIRGFIKHRHRRRLDELRDSIADYRRMIEESERQIAAWEDSLERNLNEQFGLLNRGLDEQKNTEETRAMNYLSSNKHILVSEDGESNMMQVLVCGHIRLFDPDRFEQLISNKNSYVYSKVRELDPELTKEEIELLLRAVFEEELIKVRVYSCVSIGKDITDIRIRGVGLDIYNSYVPNEHIQTYKCFGSYSSVLRNAIRKCDCVSIFETLLSATESINFNDMTAGSVYIKSMFNPYTDCYGLPDGRYVSAYKAIEWIKERSKVSEN